ncbi:Chromosomal replication initiator protein DnaA [Afipia felis]
MAVNFVSIATIVHVCAAIFGVSERDIRSVRRDREAVDARAAVALVAHEMTELTLEKIGKGIDRDHSTVRNAVHLARRRCGSSEAYARKVEAVRQSVKLVAATGLEALRNSNLALEAAQRVCKDPVHEAMCVSAVEAAAMAVRLVALEFFATAVHALLFPDTANLTAKLGELGRPIKTVNETAQESTHV